MKKINRLGEIRENIYGTKMKIIEYNDANDILVEFQDEIKHIQHTSYSAFKKGKVSNPFDKTYLEIGYLGVGNYNSYDNQEIYSHWSNMLQRCYNNKQLSYFDCEVCDEWLCFQNFAKWYEENYYEVEGEIMCLDKDIFLKNNKIYSPTTCFFVPKRINNLFTKRQNDRGDTAVGVNYHKATGKYQARCNTIDNKGKIKRVYLGVYKTEEEAFEVYKNFKENYIKQVADEYYNYIPRELWKALWEYQVEITD